MEQYDVIMKLNNVIVSMKLSLDVILCNFGYPIKRGFEVIEDGGGRSLQAKKKPSLNRVTSTEFVETSLFSTGSRPWDNGGRGGGGHPYSEIRWGGGRSPKIFFGPFRPLKIRGGKWAPRAPPLDPPLLLFLFASVFFYYVCLFSLVPAA